MRLELDDGEHARLREWKDTHVVDQHNGKWPYAGAIGGSVSLIVTGTSIGQILSVECSHCRVANKPRETYSYCLTDFSDW